ncbi:MAG: hypothetical protein WCR33_01050 [Bacilli bacterium]
MEKSGIYNYSENLRKKAKKDTVIKFSILIIGTLIIFVLIFWLTKDKIITRWPYYVLLVVLIIVYILWYLRNINYNYLNIPNFTITRENDRLILSRRNNKELIILISNIKEISAVNVLYNKLYVKLYIKILKKHIILVPYVLIKDMDTILDTLFTKEEIRKLGAK